MLSFRWRRSSQTAGARRKLQRMSGRGIPFVFDRLSEIRDQLHLYGFRLDPRPGTSYVDPTYAAEPRTGIVEVTAGLEDCPLDVRVQLVEHWRAGIDGRMPSVA
jgi:hypothetical protein